MPDMKDDIKEILISKEELQAIVSRIGGEISRDYDGKKPILVSILKGSIVFMADLMRAITIPCEIDFMAVSSYGSGVKTSGVVKIIKDLDRDIHGRDLIIVEDILDSGMTLPTFSSCFRQGVRGALRSPPFSTSLPAARWMFLPSIPAQRFPMNLSWDTVLITTRFTAIFPLSAF